MLACTKHARQFVRPSSLLINRNVSSTSCVCGRKSHKPFDRRFPITPKDVNEWKEGGKREIRQKLGSTGMMRPQRPGYVNKDGMFVFVQEMVPEFIVPDLKDFDLKPYVSYKVTEIKQSEFTAKDMFDALYSKKVKDDWIKEKLDEKDPNTTYLTSKKS